MYCSGKCIYLDEKKHKCDCTGERLAYMKYSGNGIKYTVHEHNGVSQTVTATQGIALKRLEQVKPRVSLSPYRTFTEVEQPESEFILRMDEDGRVGLFEADGGKWKLDAKAKIAAYFETALAEEVGGGRVVVMM